MKPTQDSTSSNQAGSIGAQGQNDATGQRQDAQGQRQNVPGQRQENHRQGAGTMEQDNQRISGNSGQYEGTRRVDQEENRQIRQDESGRRREEEDRRLNPMDRVSAESSERSETTPRNDKGFTPEKGVNLNDQDRLQRGATSQK